MPDTIQEDIPDLEILKLLLCTRSPCLANSEKCVSLRMRVLYNPSVILPFSNDCPL